MQQLNCGIGESPSATAFTVCTSQKHGGKSTHLRLTAVSVSSFSSVLALYGDNMASESAPSADIRIFQSAVGRDTQPSHRSDSDFAVNTVVSESDSRSIAGTLARVNGRCDFYNETKMSA
ncbi:MAG: hypothetical protein NC340_04565 [Ruminococcus flavefaciens]|nr:hypothetical protein [Ruminococcus flavefaciens]MCM1229063.1 hypothetical protein [Ruminococcus flavefaciens]